MRDFDHILNWTLLPGSHPFPGPDGGTCINEAAIVAYGFPYRQVSKIQDIPSCFSRPICLLAMRLNDMASDDERKLLLPFVTRLACADTLTVEMRRSRYISKHFPFNYLYMHFLTFEQGLRTLEGALAIGRQADSLGIEVASRRLDAARKSHPHKEEYLELEHNDAATSSRWWEKIFSISN